MNNRKVNSDNSVHTFKISSDRHSFKTDIRTTLVDDGEVKKIHFTNSVFEINGGFKKIILEVETDQSQIIRQFYIIVDIYYVPPDYLIGEEDLVKLGRVNYSGNLVQDAFHTKPRWKGHMIVSCPFTKDNSDELPDKVQDVGPGAFITAVIQTLFGTLEGMKMLGLEGYKIPDSVGDEIQFTVN